jgi:hypothetical protein
MAPTPAVEGRAFGDWLCGRLLCCGVASWEGEGADIAGGPPGVDGTPVGVGADGICGVEGIGLLPGRVFSGETTSIFGLPSFVATAAGGNKPFAMGAFGAVPPGVGGC